MKIRVYPNDDTLSVAAAELFIASAESSIERTGNFFVVLSGGSTPTQTYERLSSPGFKKRVNWPLIHFFWGDERCVPLGDPHSNFGTAQESLLSRVPISPDQVHPMKCESDAMAAATHYETELRKVVGTRSPIFDLVMLGLGTDGHTASLFPDSPSLSENDRWVCDSRRAKETFSRVTLTPTAINSARTVVFLVSGKAKARVLKDVVTGPSNRFPAQLIEPKDGELLWLVDEAAASLFNDDELKGFA